ncbi:MAG TPA: signal peptidase I [Spirochaetia bacterium]|nr:signal peptidase I [Spirochaetia bacterium]
MTRRRIAGPRRERLSAARIIVAAVALAVALKAFAFDLVIVRGDSMSPTIGSGAVAVVSPCAYGLRLPLSGSYLVRWGEPAPGDVVLVSPFPPERRRAVKRVFDVGPAYLVAEAGSLRGRGGIVPLGPSPHSSLAGSAYLPAGRAFVVGDNVGRSIDSRRYGSVPIEKLAGKVLLWFGGAADRTLQTISSKDAAEDADR